jgi:uncharacterized protein (TIGR04222 family)
MDWLPQPFSGLSGPAFLLVYAAFAAAVIIVSRLQVTAADRSLTGPLPPVSPERDPYEIAYLRGGKNELLRFAIFDAVRRKVLRLAPPAKGKKTQRIEAVPEAGSAASAAPPLDKIVEFYAQPRTSEELFASPLPEAVEAWAATRFGPALESEHFFTDPAVKSTATRVRWYGSAALVIFAGLRFLEAFSLHHRNVGFLFVLLLVSFMLLLLFTQVPRLSRRGRAYLERLKEALRPPGGPAPAFVGAADAAGILDPIFVAVTGLQALANTEFAPINKLFPARVSSGGDSGGCGSSGGGSSCSSGGGCGGGGCGG